MTTDQTPMQAAAEALAYQVHMMSRPTPPTFLDEAYEALDAATQDVEGLARVLYEAVPHCYEDEHGRWIDVPWDRAASQVREICYREAQAIRAHMLGTDDGSDR
jgi:hypothetical protein